MWQWQGGETAFETAKRQQGGGGGGTGVLATAHYRTGQCSQTGPRSSGFYRLRSWLMAIAVASQQSVGLCFWQSAICRCGKA
jgi:hypothetical protein